MIEHKLLIACKNSGQNISTVYDFVDKAVKKEKTDKLNVFLQDLDEFSKQSATKEVKSKSLLFTISNTLDDLLSLGRDTGGCQNIDGIPSINKCLLGYADGKHNFFALRQNGRMVARAVVTFFFDEKTRSLVWLVEPVYTLNPDLRLKVTLTNQIIQRAIAFKNKASEFKVDVKLAFGDKFDNSVFSTTTPPSKSSSTTELKSHGCVAPYEYCDSAGGITKGSYVIKNPSFYQL